MVSFIGMLAAMVSMALAMCSLALAVVIYRCVRGIATSRQERQETAQTVPAAAVPAAVVTARGGADGSLGRVIIARWFGRPVVSLDAWSARLVVSCLCAVGERLLSSRVSVGYVLCVGQCRGSLFVMRRLVLLWPLVAAWAGRSLAPCQMVGRGPPARNAHFLSLIVAATPPYKPENRGLAQIPKTSPRCKAFERKAYESYHYPSITAMVDHRPSRQSIGLFSMADQEILPPGRAARYPAVDGRHCGAQRPLPDRAH